MELAQLGGRGCVAGVDVAKKVFGLAVKLIEVGPDGQAADGHDEPPSMSPWSAASGKEVRLSRPNVCQSGQVDSVLPADGRRPARPPQITTEGPRAQGAICRRQVRFRPPALKPSSAPIITPTDGAHARRPPRPL